MYCRVIQQLGIDVFLTVDFLPSYLSYLQAAPGIPTVIWFRDPRGRREWEEMAAVPLELEWRRCASAEELASRAEHTILALRSVVSGSRRISRRLAFAANGTELATRARRAYELPETEVSLLPNPVPCPADIGEAASRPTLAFVGRLDPVKRPWIALELARRFPLVDFAFLGISNFPERMEERLRAGRALPNVRFLGVVDGAQKEHAFASAWGLVNTSVHEGVPISFLESFARARPVISCVDPLGMVSRFGYFAGEIPAEGMSEEAIGRLSVQVRRFLADDGERARRGREARAFVEREFSFDSFAAGRRTVLEGLHVRRSR